MSHSRSTIHHPRVWTFQHAPRPALRACTTVSLGASGPGRAARCTLHVGLVWVAWALKTSECGADALDGPWSIAVHFRRLAGGAALL
jgi:hypothetical protein